MPYAIGIDYGTQSARAELVDLVDGTIVASAEGGYPHGVMETRLPSGAQLGPGWALQDGRDYWDLLVRLVRRLVAGVDPDAVVGIGLDSTSCSVLPLDAEMEPLSSHPEFEDVPLAHLALWKHHAAQPYADRLTRIAAERGEPFLARYGGRISSEWLIPKIMQVAAEAPDVYRAAHRFSEVADWLCFKLTGTHVKSNVMAGYKSLWEEGTGYPGPDFFAALDPLLENVVAEKLPAPVRTVGGRVGHLSPAVAAELGLTTRTAVAVAQSDACVVPAALGMDQVGQLVMSIGTSTCHLLLGDVQREVPGMCGAVKDGTSPGFISYELGQAAVGDIFDWFVRTCVPDAVVEQARAAGIGTHELLERQAAALAVGASGLVALDWWNGNRSILVDADLTGVVVGLTLASTPAEIYRALIEATAFGTRTIVETLRESGVPVTELYAAGGIPSKNALLVQVYADVCGMDVLVPALAQSAAYGSALFGAVAAGREAGGFDTVAEATDALGCREFTRYRPREDAVAAYHPLYEIYRELHDLLGAANGPLKRLRAVADAASRPSVTPADPA